MAEWREPATCSTCPALGISDRVPQTTTEDSGGELVEFDLVGRPQGFVTVPHVHPRQSERHEVIEGSFLIKTGGLERLFAPGGASNVRAPQDAALSARSTGWREEHALMAPLPAQPPDVDRRWVLRVPPDPHLRFDSCDYSLDPGLVGKRVEARVSPTRGPGGRAGHRRARLPPPAQLRQASDDHRSRARAGAARRPRRVEPAVEIRPLARYDALIA